MMTQIKENVLLFDEDDYGTYFLSIDKKIFQYNYCLLRHYPLPCFFNLKTFQSLDFVFILKK
jgi:hypothetical protein